MNHYRKLLSNTVNDVKLKMQIGALTLKLSENRNKIDNLIQKIMNQKKIYKRTLN